MRGLLGGLLGVLLALAFIIAGNLVAIQVQLPADVTEGPLRFEVVQQAGKRGVGGSACFV